MKPSRALNNPVLFGKPWLLSLIPLLERRGFNTAKVLQGLPNFSGEVKTADYRLTHLQVQQLLAQVELEVSDPHIWQLVAETFFQNSLSPIIELCSQSSSFSQVLKLAYRYRDLAVLNMIVLPQQSKSGMTIDLIPFSGARSKLSQASQTASYKLTVALFFTLAKQLNIDLSQWKLYLPEDVSPLPIWEKWLPVIHTRGVARISIPSQCLQASFQPNQQRFNQALYFCQLQRHAVGGPAQFERIFRWLLQQLNNGQDVSLSELSAYLNMSVSSCKRLFASVGQSYQGFYDNVRLYKLLCLLELPGGTNSELASQLGYSNPNNFRRACKRWLGIAPNQLRQRTVV